MANARDVYEDTGWWRNHFSGLLLDLWQTIVPRDQAAKDADFLQRECRLSAGASVLDVPCGEGRVALELADRGHRVVGVDISPGLIAETRRQASARQLAVEWHEADMRTLPWAESFDAAYCWGDSFGYLDDDGNRQFLEAVRRTLKPGGRFALEMQMVAETLLPRFRAEESGDVAGTAVRVRRNYDPRRGRLAVEYSLSRAGVDERRTASYRIYTCRQICDMLQHADFEVDHVYGGADEPFQIGSDRLRIVATKTPQIDLP